jgi:competence protein ComEC
LIQHYGAALRASVLIVPHHGSHTSSSLAFLRTVAPEYAIFSYGFDNRYHFPHAKILSRYHALNILTGGTAEHGMITVHFSQKQWQYAYYADLLG